MANPLEPRSANSQRPDPLSSEAIDAHNAAYETVAPPPTHAGEKFAFQKHVLSVVLLFVALFAGLALFGYWHTAEKKVQSYDALRDYALNLAAQQKAVVQADPNWSARANMAAEKMDFTGAFRRLSREHPKEFSRIASEIEKNQSYGPSLAEIQTLDAVVYQVIVKSSLPFADGVAIIKKVLTETVKS